MKEYTVYTKSDELNTILRNAAGETYGLRLVIKSGMGVAELDTISIQTEDEKAILTCSFEVCRQGTRFIPNYLKYIMTSSDAATRDILSDLCITQGVKGTADDKLYAYMSEITVRHEWQRKGLAKFVHGHMFDILHEMTGEDVSFIITLVGDGQGLPTLHDKVLYKSYILSGFEQLSSMNENVLIRKNLRL